MQCFVILVVLAISSEAFSQAYKKSALVKALDSIAEALAQQNHFVTFVREVNTTDLANPASITMLLRIPYVVAGFDCTRNNFTLNSSAIVTLQSVKSLRSFNSHTILPKTFSD